MNSNNSHRQHLDERLLELQRDVSHLRAKLMHDSKGLEDNDSSLQDITRLNQIGKTDPYQRQDSSLLGSSHVSSIPPLEHSNISLRSVGAKSKKKSTSINDSTVASRNVARNNQSIKLVRIQRELRDITAERDKLKYALEQANKENERLKNKLVKIFQLQQENKQLKDDYEELKESFKSSEMLRRRQKKLITMLKEEKKLVNSIPIEEEENSDIRQKNVPVRKHRQEFGTSSISSRILHGHTSPESSQEIIVSSPDLQHLHLNISSKTTPGKTQKKIDKKKKNISMIESKDYEIQRVSFQPRQFLNKKKKYVPPKLKQPIKQRKNPPKNLVSSSLLRPTQASISRMNAQFQQYGHSHWLR